MAKKIGNRELLFLQKHLKKKRHFYNLFLRHLIIVKNSANCLTLFLFELMFDPTSKCIDSRTNQYERQIFEIKE